ncbi:PilP family type IV pilus biogenesis protein [Trabulsiella guamensis ATCC 49490]|uniref:PilP family type IV pilus biogenesis protein n=1 Tax=Trabulsiella guamensis ATCC 49490 TaxID=1005994 RepID=A0A085A3D3_9ENTR|nr:HofP DNA utilization family protein [Trabulsiella guamensis]KFC04728.1 PilP family type IV pilus biogenesis protein [Trabulsiella guamensis ATCC 49490]
MASKASSWLLIALLPALMGMRDPFAPPVDLCHTSQLAQWHYRGSISHAHRRIGLIKDSEGKWLRVEPGMSFVTGWHLVAITEADMTIDTGEGCDPARWTWIKEGEKNESMDKPVALPAGTVSSGRKERLAGGG